MGCCASNPKQAKPPAPPPRKPDPPKQGAAEPKKVEKVEEDDITKVTRLLKKNTVDSSPNVNDKYTMFLDLRNNKKGCHDFLSEAKGAKIGKLKKVRERKINVV